MAKINGRVVELSFGSPPVRVCGGQSITLNVDIDLPDATTQCGEDGWEEQIHGIRDWNADSDGLFDDAAELNTDALIASGLNEEVLDMTLEIGASTFTAKCLLGSVNLNDDMEAPVGYSFTVNGSDDGGLVLT